MKLAVLIVSYNSELTIESVLTALESETINHEVFILDNASVDKTVEVLSRFKDAFVIESKANLGFCAGNNVILNRAYGLGFSHFLFLNPDAKPLEGALETFSKIASSTEISAFTPKIFRSTKSLELLNPPTIDAAGIYFTKNFRHLDRGAGQLDSGQFNQNEFVIGGTGAALFVTRRFVEQVSFKQTDGSFELFDERFFAYREDAELALRATRYGLQCQYLAEVKFVHLRRVTPERRAKLAPFLNALSVRNRLLLLLSHYSWSWPIRIQALIWLRNLLVFGYAVIFEPQSRKLLLQSIFAIRTHLDRREVIRTKASSQRVSSSDIFS